MDTRVHALTHPPTHWAALTHPSANHCSGVGWAP
jgi:hypothetical protein